MENIATISLEVAEIDLLCENCHRVITVGQDYYYDHLSEEIRCEECEEIHSL